MRRGLAFGAWLLLTCGVRPALADPSTSGQALPGQTPKTDQLVHHVITNPDWLERPSGESVASVYPPLTQILRLSGRVEMKCAVEATGGLVGCAILDEIPMGFGFGEAALRMSNTFKMKPQLVDGVPVSGATVNIPINFTIPVQAENEGPGEAPHAPAPSAAALALARRLVMASFDESGAATTIKNALAQLRDQSSSARFSAEEQLALNAFEQAAQDALPNGLERLARRFATALPDSQLAQAVAFMESPAGKAFTSLWTVVGASDLDTSDSLERSIARDARARLCHQIKCLVQSDVPSASPPPAAPE